MVNALRNASLLFSKVLSHGIKHPRGEVLSEMDIKRAVTVNLIIASLDESFEIETKGRRFLAFKRVRYIPTNV